MDNLRSRVAERTIFVETSSDPALLKVVIRDTDQEVFLSFSKRPSKRFPDSSVGLWTGNWICTSQRLRAESTYPVRWFRNCSSSPVRRLSSASRRDAQ